MNDPSIFNRPTALEAILRETADLGFSMASELQTGSLLEHSPLRSRRGDFSSLAPGPASQPHGFWRGWIRDLLPQPNRPAGRAPTVSALIERLATHDGFVATKLAWVSGLIVVRTR
jgi:hypothetical protein